MEFDLEYLAENFEYKSDGKLDNWRIMPKDDLRGDCDDYGVTALYILSDHNLLKFWFNILIFRAIFWHCLSPRGRPHMVLQFEGKYIDNWDKKLLPKSSFDEKGYKFNYPMIIIFPIVKMSVGKIASLWKRYLK